MTELYVLNNEEENKTKQKISKSIALAEVTHSEVITLLIFTPGRDRECFSHLRTLQLFPALINEQHLLCVW